MWKKGLQGIMNLLVIFLRLDFLSFDFPSIAQVGVELGVQTGSYSANNLQKWPSCERYVMVDLWQSQENYNDR